MKNFKRIVAVVSDGITFLGCLTGALGAWGIIIKGIVEPNFYVSAYAVIFTIGAIRSLIRMA